MKNALFLFCLFVSLNIQAADNTLKSIKLYDASYTTNGAENLPGFSASQQSYIVPLSYTYAGGIPQVSAEKNDTQASVTITQATSLVGTEAEATAKITVKASGLSDRAYTVTFRKTKDYIEGIFYDQNKSADFTSTMFRRTAGESHGTYWGNFAVRPNSTGSQYLLTSELTYGAKKLSFYVKKCHLEAKDNQQSALIIEYTTSTSGWIKLDSILAVSQTDTWQFKEYDLNIKDSSIQIRFRIYKFVANSETRDFFIDDILVTPAMEVPSYTPRSPLPDPNAGPIPIPSSTTTWQSSLVKMDNEGNLSYYQDADGFVLSNFSHAGYKGGDTEIPDVPVVKTIECIDGDNTSHIQMAIEEIGRMPLVNGIRGALLLKKGLYSVKGPIKVLHEGIVLRGEGNDENPENSTIIYDWFRDADGYDAQRNVIELGFANGSWTSDRQFETNILDDVVPIGSYTVKIAKNNNYRIGDAVCIYHPCSNAWLAAVKYGEVGPVGSAYTQEFAWTTSTAPIYYHRYVKNVVHQGLETIITLDAPVFYPLKKSLSQCTIYRIPNQVSRNIGIENLRIATNATTIPDEKHAWNCVHIKNSEDCWAKNVVAVNFGKSGFYTNRTTRTTFEDCFSLDPIAQVIGERMYNYSLSSQSQLILFKNCYARAGRHNYISNGTSTVSGCVIYNSKSEASRTRSEGHRMWTQGLLFDSYEDFNPISANTTIATLGLFNRWEQGSGHGWATANSVLWNCNLRTDHTTADAKKNAPKNARSMITLEKPPTSQNYAIGCFLEQSGDIKTFSTGKTLGYIEGTNKAGLQPSSLYKAQWDLRQKSGTSLPDFLTSSPRISIYPNPATDYINIVTENDYSGEYVVDIFSFDGKKVLSTKIGSTEKISISSFPKGVYLARILTGTIIRTIKFTVL